ncbi:MAG: SDR family oxidoreductase [Cyanobacteria bacterium]|nr:SDR family oxidoreductase [Cyanobacteriota bacterium]
MPPVSTKSKRVLVTGGAGFIGSHLVERLLGQGHDVICLDNFFTGSKGNLLHLLDNPYLEVIRHDVIEPILIEVDEIYNLACPASPVHYQSNPVKTVKTNVMGMINMLGLAKRTKARILQASTSEVYGEPLEHPQTENYWGHVNPVGIRSCYDEGKRVAETLCMDYHRQNRLTVKIVRIFNTYGPRMFEQDGRVVSNFIVQALQNKPLTIYGEGSQTRSFCYVDDLVSGMMKMMEWDQDAQGGFTFPGPVNLGNPHEITVRELADHVLALTGSSSKIEKLPLPSDDPTHRRPDITMAKKKLNWEPHVQLEEGLKKTIAYFEKQLSKTASRPSSVTVP